MTTKTKKVTAHTRAGKYRGRILECPKCGKRFPIFHFAWSALQCLGCKKAIEKKNWIDCGLE